MKKINNKETIIIITIYLLITIILITRNAILYTNLVNPLFWFCILVYLLWKIKKDYIRLKTKRKVSIYMLIISFIYLAIYFYMGFILDFSKSPYSHSISSIIQNVIIQIIPIIGIETVRCIISIRNKSNKLVLICIAIILALIEIKYNILLDLLSDKEKLFQYICEIVIPILSGSFLFTYLASKGAWKASLLCRIFNKLVLLLLPILPNANWFLNGTMSIISQVIIYLLFKYRFFKNKTEIKNRKENITTKIVYTIIIVICITLVSFVMGLFKYEPIAIASNSMYPSFIRGDVVIFKKLNESELNKIPEGSIIVYSVSNQNVAHRVVKVIEKENKVLYQTKGDSNNVPDMLLVEKSQIKGVYVLCIKYIGYPSVWLYDYFKNN